jgi:hypothetical protein
LVNRIKNKIVTVIKDNVRNVHIFKYNQIDRKIQIKSIYSKIENTILNLDVFTHNSPVPRTVEIDPYDKELKNVIVTCYFTGKPDPQSGLLRNDADFKYIQPWYESLEKLGIDGIILHDGLSDSFIQKYQTNKIQFRFCEMGNYSIFEERWFLYHILISKLEKLEMVFLTDSNDVYINSNPFTQFNNNRKLYVGRDNANRIKDSGWLLDELNDYINESRLKVPKSYFFQSAYNAGVVGGSKDTMFFLTSKMVDLIMNSNSNKHKDMSILNLSIHFHFAPKLSKHNYSQKLVDTNDDQYSCSELVFTGFPFNSGFKDFDFNSKAVFIHK